MDEAVSQHGTAALAITAALLLSAAHIWYSLGSNDKKKWPPLAPTTFFETVREFGGPQGPIWLHGVGKAMGRKTFRVPLPICIKKGFYMVGDGDLAREIFCDKTTDKPAFLYAQFESITLVSNMGMRSSHDAYWKKERKGTATAFSKNEVVRMNSITSRLADEWVDGRLAELVKKDEAFDPAFEFNRLAFFSIMEAAFEYVPTEEEFQQMHHHMRVATKEFCARQVASPWRKFMPFLPGVQEGKASALCIRTFCRKVLLAYRNNPNKSKDSKTLIRLLEEVTPDDKHKVAEILGWIIAGHDTTGYSLSNATVLLAKHPEVQEKLRKEITGSEKPESVPLFQHVIKETSRMIPVAGMVSVRLIGRDFLCNDGSIIPEGAACIINQYSVNHDETVYKYPSRFLPERWENPTEEMIRNRFPFALGPQSCPAQRLAVSNMDMILPRVMAKYSFELIQEGKPENFLVFRIFGSRVKAKALKTSFRTVL